MECVRAILPCILDFQVLFDGGGDKQPLTYLTIGCHDLCKLMHFGSAQVKLIASFCLLELFTGISDYTSRETFDLKFTEGYIMSISAILQALIFSGDIRVATNCSHCLSTLMTLNQPKIGSLVSEKDSWCRLIVEELVMSLSTRNLTNAFMIHHKPAARIAVALLRLSKGPPWMNKVFDDSSIQSIVQNISVNNLTVELVILFRELLSCGYLSSAHVAHLNRVFQACRSRLYADETEDSSTENPTEKEAASGVGKALVYLVGLACSQSHPECERSQNEKKQLLGEIELYSKCLMEEDKA